MSDKKNIDRLFQEKFKNFEATPNDSVWNGISEELAGKKKKRRLIPIWWQIGGVAAAIALLLTIGVAVFNSDSNPQDLPIVNTDKNLNEQNREDNKGDNAKPFLKDKQKELNTLENNSVTENSNIYENNNSKDLNRSKVQSQPNNSVAENSKDSNQNSKVKTQKLNQLSKKASKNNTSVVDNSIKAKSLKSDASSKNTNQKMKSAMEKAMRDETNAVTDNSDSNSKNSEKTNSDVFQNKTDKNKTKELTESLDKKQSIEEALASNEEDPIIEKEEDKQSRWSVAPNVAPVYFSSLGQGSSLDNQFNENSKGSDINMSYGITGSYAVSERLKIRAGIHRVDLNQKTSDVFAFTSASTTARSLDAQYKNISFKDGVQSVSMISSKMISRSTAPEVFNTQTTGNIDQRFGFIEVPLELEYRLVNKKFGINLIGGFSTFFLNNNEIYADIDGTSTLIGEANNINTTSFSANFGLGMDYSLSKQWNINVEPTFKYQINTFNNTTGGFRPFFIGVYTGLSFKF